MVMTPGIYGIVGTDDYVVGAEVGGMFMTSEVLDDDDIQDLITGAFSLADYALTDERNRAAEKFEFVPYEKWPEILGSEVDLQEDFTAGRD